MKGKYQLLSPVLLLMLCSCATIMQPGPDRIQVRSDPDGAKVYLNTMPVGATPMEVHVNRKDRCVIEVKKDGYETVLIDREKVVAGWVFGNILLGGIIGLSIDLITHNQGKYPEDPIYVNLAHKP